MSCGFAHAHTVLQESPERGLPWTRSRAGVTLEAERESPELSGHRFVFVLRVLSVKSCIYVIYVVCISVG